MMFNMLNYEHKILISQMTITCVIQFLIAVHQIDLPQHRLPDNILFRVFKIALRNYEV